MFLNLYLVIICKLTLQNYIYLTKKHNDTNKQKKNTPKALTLRVLYKITFSNVLFISFFYYII